MFLHSAPQIVMVRFSAIRYRISTVSLGPLYMSNSLPTGQQNSRIYVLLKTKASYVWAVVRSFVIILLHINSWVRWWKNFLKIDQHLVKLMARSNKSLFFLTHGYILKLFPVFWSLAAQTRSPGKSSTVLQIRLDWWTVHEYRTLS